jgi:hypothetical protein
MCFARGYSKEYNEYPVSVSRAFVSVVHDLSMTAGDLPGLQAAKGCQRLQSCGVWPELLITDHLRENAVTQAL